MGTLAQCIPKKKKVIFVSGKQFEVSLVRTFLISIALHSLTKLPVWMLTGNTDSKGADVLARNTVKTLTPDFEKHATYL